MKKCLVKSFEKSRVYKPIERKNIQFTKIYNIDAIDVHRQGKIYAGIMTSMNSYLFFQQVYYTYVFCRIRKPRILIFELHNDSLCDAIYKPIDDQFWPPYSQEVNLFFFLSFFQSNFSFFLSFFYQSNAFIHVQHCET